MKSAGVFVQAETTGRYLFLFHDERGVWEGSGGHVEPFETMARAALREFREETGYRWGVTLGPARCSESFCLYLGLVRAQFVPRLSYEHSGYRWAYLDEAPRPLHPLLAQLIRRFGYAVRC